MPRFTSNETGLLVGRTPRFVVVLSSLEESMVSGEAAILDLGLSSVRTFRQHLQRGSYHLYVSITELVPSSCDEDELGEPLFWSSLALCATT